MDTIKVNLLDLPLRSLADAPAPLSTVEEPATERPLAIHATDRAQALLREARLEASAREALVARPERPVSLGATPVATPASGALAPAPVGVGGRLLVLAALAASVVLGHQAPSPRLRSQVVASTAVRTAPAQPSSRVAPPASSSLQVLDPVCGRPVHSSGNAFVANVGGQTLYFDSVACRQRFESNPLAYAKVVHHVRFRLTQSHPHSGVGQTNPTSSTTAHVAPHPPQGVQPSVVSPGSQPAVPEMTVAPDAPSVDEAAQPTFGAAQVPASTDSRASADAPSVVESAPFLATPPPLGLHGQVRR